MSPRKARRLPAAVPRRPRRAGRVAAVPASPAAPDGDQSGPVRLGPPRTESRPDGDWVVRQVPGAAATKEYRCPGCDQEIRSATPHLVVWPAEVPGPAERRHWHSGCWQRQPRRPPPGAGRGR